MSEPWGIWKSRCPITASVAPSLNLKGDFSLGFHAHSTDSGSPFRLKIYFAGWRPALSKQFRRPVSFRFVPFVAQCVSQLVSDGVYKKILDAHSPRRLQVETPPWYLCYQRIFEKGFLSRVVSECRTVWIQPPWRHDCFPVLRTHQNPRPLSKLTHGIFCKRLLQNGHVCAALFECVSCVANKVLLGKIPSLRQLGGWGLCLSLVQHKYSSD
jgi:hypothetical protein